MYTHVGGREQDVGVGSLPTSGSQGLNSAHPPSRQDLYPLSPARTFEVQELVSHMWVFCVWAAPGTSPFYSKEICGGDPGVLQTLPLEPRASGTSLLVCEMDLNSPGLATAREGPGTLPEWPFICAWHSSQCHLVPPVPRVNLKEGARLGKLSGGKMGQHRRAGQVKSPVSQALPASVPELVSQVTPAVGISYLNSTFPHRNCSH